MTVVCDSGGWGGRGGRGRECGVLAALTEPQVFSATPRNKDFGTVFDSLASGCVNQNTSVGRRPLPLGRPSPSASPQPYSPTNKGMTLHRSCVRPPLPTRPPPSPSPRRSPEHNEIFTTALVSLKYSVFRQGSLYSLGFRTSSRDLP